MKIRIIYELVLSISPHGRQIAAPTDSIQPDGNAVGANCVRPRAVADRPYHTTQTHCAFVGGSPCPPVRLRGVCSGGDGTPPLRILTDHGARL